MKAIFNQEKHQDNAVNRDIKKERIRQIIVVDDGVTPSPIDGRGDDAMRDAAIALAAAIGYDDVILVE